MRARLVLLCVPLGSEFHRETFLMGIRLPHLCGLKRVPLYLVHCPRVDRPEHGAINPLSTFRPQVSDIHFSYLVDELYYFWYRAD